MTFVFTSEHGWALLVTLLIAFESAIFGMLAGRVRGRIFTPNFMVEKFGGLHLQAFNAEISKSGYPDMGNGRYSDALSYKDWVNFNDAQRAHYNHLENVNAYVTFLLVAAINFPFEAAVIGAILFLARLGYAISYHRNGADDTFRRFSSIVSNLSSYALLAYAIASCFEIINQATIVNSDSGSNDNPAVPDTSSTGNDTPVTDSGSTDSGATDSGVTPDATAQ